MKFISRKMARIRNESSRLTPVRTRKVVNQTKRRVTVARKMSVKGRLIRIADRLNVTGNGAVYRYGEFRQLNPTLARLGWSPIDS